MSLLRKIAIPVACLALIAGGATLAIASKGGGTSGGNASSTQYTGGTGCTPGFWKNNNGAWTGSGFSPTDNFDKVFGITHYGSLTLQGALEFGGGGFAALARHAAAALLNSGTKTIKFEFNTAKVIKLVQEAVATNEPEAIKDTLAAANESGCSLPADESKKPKK
jgi:hypothetical protein